MQLTSKGKEAATPGEAPPPSRASGVPPRRPKRMGAAPPSKAPPVSSAPLSPWS